MGKYLEGNYDSDNLAISNRQRMNDELEAWQIEREAQKYQETAKESEAKRILGEEQVSDAEIEKVFQEYAEEDKWRQYLVNGAVLTCNQATWEPFKVPGQENIVLEQNCQTAHCGRGKPHFDFGNNISPKSEAKRA